MGRYDRNGIFSKEEMEIIQASTVCVIGSGGLGGYILEMLARTGVGHVKIVDGDVFDESNLNRQLLSTVENIGNVKVVEAEKRISLVNPEIKIHAVHAFAEAGNMIEILEGADVAVDALDNISTRRLLQDSCEEMAIPLIHGAIAGWYGQVSTIFPGDRTLDRLYPLDTRSGIEESLGNPSFIPATVASIQVAEALKVIVGKDELLRNQVLMVDLLDNEFQIIAI